MEQAELARENHGFLVTKVPNCMLGEVFQATLGSAYVLMKDIREDRRAVFLDDFRHCAFENGYVGVTAPAAEAIIDDDVDLYKMATALYLAFGPNKDTGEVNNRVVICVNGRAFTFTITDYETNDPEKGWINCTQDPLSIPLEQEMHRRVIIDLGQKFDR